MERGKRIGLLAGAALLGVGTIAHAEGVERAEPASQVIERTNEPVAVFEAKKAKSGGPFKLSDSQLEEITAAGQVRKAIEFSDAQLDNITVNPAHMPPTVDGKIPLLPALNQLRQGEPIIIPNVTPSEYRPTFSYPVGIVR